MNRDMHLPIQWLVPADHPAFAGHFPGMPILPGVVLLDLAIQFITDVRACAPQSCTINSVKFLNPAVPGDLLLFEHSQAENGLIRFEISTELRKIATGSILLDTAP